MQTFWLAIVFLFEAYIFFQLPGAKYFWNAVEHGEDPNHGKIRLAAMACIVLFLIFALKWAFFLALYFITTIRIDGIINFCRVPHEERLRIFKTEGISELKSYMFLIISIPFITAIIVVAFFAFFENSTPKISEKSRALNTYKMQKGENVKKPLMKKMPNPRALNYPKVNKTQKQTTHNVAKTGDKEN